MKTYLIIVLLAVGAASRKWDKLEKTQEVLNAYRRTAEDVISTMEETILNCTQQSAKIWANIEELPFVKEKQSLREYDSCKEMYIDTKELNDNFKLLFIGLEEGMLKRKSEIQGRFVEVMSTLSLLKELGDMKALRCEATDSVCFENVGSWLEGKLDELVCKITPDCKKHTIAKRYSSYGSCGGDRFRCRNGNCISGSYVCDGSCDCRSECDDEPRDCKRTCFGGFHCKNSKCIAKKKVCDDVDDCGDNSDEELCIKRNRMEIRSNCTMETGGFLCNNGLCVNASNVCDGVDDCKDGSEEGGLCGKTLCDPGCSAVGGVCFGTPKGSLCLSQCPSGTTETHQGCLPGPQVPPATIGELLEDVPRVISRYMANSQLLQRRVMEKIFESLSNVADCRSQKHSAIGKLTRLKINKFNVKEVTTPKSETLATESETLATESEPLTTETTTTSDYDYLG